MIRIKRLICLALLSVMLIPAISVAATAQAIKGYHDQAYQYVSFGRYPQTAKGDEEPVRWRVLSVKDNKALLLSDLVLDVRPVHSRAYQSWADSELHQWLNGEFADRLLSGEEKKALLSEKDCAGVDLPSSDLMKKEAYGFKTNASRKAGATEYAAQKGVHRKNAVYWTSTPSTSKKNSQRCISNEGAVQWRAAEHTKTGVRPILLLDMSLISITQGEGTKEAPLELVAKEGTAFQAEKQPVKQATETADLEKTDNAPEQEAPTEGFPPLTEEGFLPEGEKEYIFIDAENGVWRYASQTLRIKIDRKTIEQGPIRYLAAEIFTKEGSGEHFKMYPYDKENMTKDAQKYLARPVDIAKQHQLVFAMDGDYFLYRIRSTLKNRAAVGIEIRDGKVVVDRPPKKVRTSYPPLDNMALFADGDMQVYPALEKTADDFLAMGAMDVLSFGPYLIKDGEINTGYKWYGTTKQPRAAIGMVEKGHYWCLIVEGRIRPSKGMDCMEVSQLMKDLGCTTAFNLDGGWTSAMMFMGKQLNQLDKSGVQDNARDQNEVMGIGKTDAY